MIHSGVLTQEHTSSLYLLYPFKWIKSNAPWQWIQYAHKRVFEQLLVCIISRFHLCCAFYFHFLPKYSCGGGFSFSHAIWTQFSGDGWVCDYCFKYRSFRFVWIDSLNSPGQLKGPRRQPMKRIGAILGSCFRRTPTQVCLSFSKS